MSTGPCELSGAAVALITVQQRARVLLDTLAQWRVLGVEPLVQMQPAEWELGHASHFRNATEALKQALARTDAPAVLLTEDDVALSPHLSRRLPSLVREQQPITLYAPGTRFYPSPLARQIRRGERLAEMLVPVRNLSGYYGSLGLLLPRELLRDVLATPHLAPGHGWDVHLTRFLQQRTVPLFVAIPNLVQQRDVPPVSNVRGGKHRSAIFC